MTPHLIEKIGGVTVIVLQKATAVPTFDAHLYFKVGAGYERAEEAGISHFLEHSVFLGTKRRPHRTAVETNLLSFGGTYNAATGVSATSFLLSGALDTAAIEEGVRSLYDLGMEATLSDEVEIGKERKVVFSELEQELTENGGWSDPVQVACENLYSGGVLAQSILGSKKTLKRIGPEQLKAYHAAHYHKGAACLAVVSPLPPEEIMKRIATVCVPGRCLKSVQPREVSAPVKGVMVKGIQASSYTFDLDFFFHFPKPATHRQLVATKLMSLALFYSDMSTLYGEARRKGLVYMAHGTINSFMGAHLYRVSTTLAPEKMTRFVKLYREQVRRLCDGNIDLVFLDFCRSHFYYTRQVRRERYEMYLGLLVEKEFLREDGPLPEEEIECLKEVGVADVVAAARDVFSSESRVVTIKGPGMDDCTIGDGTQQMFEEPLLT